MQHQELKTDRQSFSELIDQSNGDLDVTKVCGLQMRERRRKYTMYNTEQHRSVERADVVKYNSQTFAILLKHRLVFALHTRAHALLNDRL